MLSYSVSISYVTVHNLLDYDVYTCFCVDLCCINLYRLKAVTGVKVFAVLLSDCIVGAVLAMTHTRTHARTHAHTHTQTHIQEQFVLFKLIKYFSGFLETISVVQKLAKLLVKVFPV